MSDIFPMKIEGQLKPIEKPEDIVYRRDQIAMLKRALKAIQEQADIEDMEYFRANNLQEITVSDTAKIVMVHDKKEKWHTEEVFDLFSFSPAQRVILPKTVDFRKKELEKALGDKAEVKALIDVEYLDKLKLVELDAKYVK